MKATSIFALVVALLSVAVVGANGGRPFTIELTGAAEVPGPGDPDGSGTVKLQMNPGKGEICYEIDVENIEELTAAHIHEAIEGQKGDIDLTLDISQKNSEGVYTGCVSATKEQILDIFKNPEEYYLNVHTASYPDGALRGQFTRGGAPDDSED